MTSQFRTLKASIRRCSLKAACFAIAIYALPANASSLVDLTTRLDAAQRQLADLAPSLGMKPQPQALSSNQDQSPIVIAQSGIGNLQLRMNAIEERIRAMTGQMEQMQFQLQQMQGQFRTYAEDSEYRFQQLEGSQGSQLQRAPTPQAPDLNTLQPSQDEPALPDILSPDQPLDLKGIFNDSGLSVEPAPHQQGQLNDNPDLDPVALNELERATQMIANGQAQDAETILLGLKDQMESKGEPAAPQVLDALGDAQFALSNYDDAVSLWMQVYRTAPEGPQSPKTLLKLADAMTALGQRDGACAMSDLAIVSNGAADASTRSKVIALQQRIGC